MLENMHLMKILLFNIIFLNINLHFNYICVIINFYTIQKGERLFEFFSRFS